MKRGRHGGGCAVPLRGGGAATRVGSGTLPRGPLFGLAMAPDCTLWIATAGGLFSLRHDTVEPYRPAIPLPAVPLFDLAVARDGTLFVASEAGLLQLQGSHWKFFTTKDGLPSNVLNMTMDGAGTLWIGTKGGLAAWRNGTIRAVRSVACSVNSLFVDLEQSVWTACSDAKGLERTTLPRISFLSPPEGLGAAPILSVAEETTGALWMSS